MLDVLLIWLLRLLQFDCKFTDIDECSNPSLNNCATNNVCVNTLGNYRCKCYQGYHGDGRKDGEGCLIAHNRTKYWPTFAGKYMSNLKGSVNNTLVT